MHTIRVEFHTNIDAYSGKSCWPKYLCVVPRVGEFVNVNTKFRGYFQEQRLPVRLEVVSVSYQEYDENTQVAMCELWYHDTDRKIAEMNGAKTL